jgi:hypothetical protein
MSRSRAILVIVIVVVVLAGVWYVRRGSETPAVIDLVQRFPVAKKEPLGAGPDVFAVRNERIAGDTRFSIYARAPTRITWRVTLPNDAWLRTSLGVDEQAWNKDGDGVLFFIAISDAGHYDVLLEQRLDPHASRADRRWVPVMLDLSRYGGHEVELMFNTRTSVKGDDARNDLAYWGAPAICLRP